MKNSKNKIMLSFFILMTCFFVVGCKKKGVATESVYEGTGFYFYNNNHGGTDSSSSIISINVKTVDDSIFFEGGNGAFSARFLKNKEGAYEYHPYREKHAFRFSGDSLYADYGYSNPTTTVSWGNFSGLKQ